MILSIIESIESIDNRVYSSFVCLAALWSTRSIHVREISVVEQNPGCSDLLLTSLLIFLWMWDKSETISAVIRWNCYKRCSFLLEQMRFFHIENFLFRSDWNWWRNFLWKSFILYAIFNDRISLKTVTVLWIESLHRFVIEISYLQCHIHYSSLFEPIIEKNVLLWHEFLIKLNHFLSQFQSSNNLCECMMSRTQLLDELLVKPLRLLCNSGDNNKQRICIQHRTQLINEILLKRIRFLLDF